MRERDELVPGHGAGGSGSVLLCGAGPFEGEMLRRALERAFFRVTVVDDTDSAVLAILELCPDVIVLGDTMPPAPRVALLRWVRGTPGIDGTSVVFLSDDVDPAVAVHAYDIGVDMVVRKPVDVDLLGRKLSAVIRRGARSAAGAGGA